ncbi:hypothetical protein D1BOALGB6SA_9831 [Olavius sp. associated proteobacterium Delta 1]|nr:hypothetical protein D1BOALGB6SA_9831 [Olavius sp. associated proteobacterium Delta 1]
MTSNGITSPWSSIIKSTAALDLVHLFLNTFDILRFQPSRWQKNGQSNRERNFLYP